ncbi:hypothetical protein ACFXPP_27290, partial [Streptomyces sp. NPDC059134]
GPGAPGRGGVGRRPGRAPRPARPRAAVACRLRGAGRAAPAEAAGQDLGPVVRILPGSRALARTLSA